MQIINKSLSVFNKKKKQNIVAQFSTSKKINFAS